MNRKFSIIAVSLTALALFAGGCNFAPKYRRPPVETPDAFKEAAGWKAAQPNDDARRGNWWEVFGDPQLNALEEQVTVSNQNVAAAFANFLGARAAVKEARASYYPVLATSPSAARMHQSGALPPASSSTASSTWSVYSLPIDASWVPDLWGNIRNNVNASTFLAQASAATLEALLLNTQADLAADYYQLRAQDRLIEVFAATVAADQKSLDLLKVQRASGIASDEDVSQAETLLRTTQAQATGLGVARAQLEHAVALLVGKSASSFSLPVEASRVVTPAIPIGVPSELLERRPDIASAERSVAAANARIGVAKAAFFPTLTLTGSAALESGDPITDLIRRPVRVWSVGAGLAETIFDAGLRSAVVDQNRAEYDATVANYRQTVLTAFQEVEDNLAALRILSVQMGQQDAAVAAAERTLALATHRYELGIDSYLNVITAQITLLNNQQTAVSLRSQQMTSSVRLIVALGGGWSAAQLPTPKELTGKAPETAGATR
jgi:NodT family efflux transporter outer membrane factor (OMF) lipoprotein